MFNFAGPPRVAINPVPLALQNELVEIKATIRCFPKCQSVIWMKNDQLIYTTDPKYDGSVNNCEFPVLCIKKVTESDNGVYKVIARNELGEGESSEDLEVIGSKYHSRYIYIYTHTPTMIKFKVTDRRGRNNVAFQYLANLHKTLW